ncbi:ParB/RepB/Spo0J family partition protein [Bosea massiliensis]|uniref:ParB/RepB/Spo0J family partition protein n=1 Tax=Bosea massiliensis TaxID=151419 RepID=A0ABW0PA25_9HYPH
MNKLVASDRNVRRTGAGDGVEELAASIRAHGLLQPLLVSSREDGRYAVIAGSRRLMALKLLSKRKALPRGFTVPVMVMEAGEEESLAENVVRMPLHPADQFEAFRRLELSGLGILPHERRTNAIHDADRLAQVTGLAMRDYWSPTVPAYLGLVTKAAIMQAVSEGVSDETAQRLGSLTKVEMAREAERLLVETAWLPACLRTSAGEVEGEQEPVAFADAAE